jgi:hypothetical protein
MVIWWMCGISLEDRKAGEELEQQLGKASVLDRERQGKLWWVDAKRRLTGYQRVDIWW